MPNLGNQIKSLKSIFGLSNSLKSNLSELKKKEKNKEKKKICRKCYCFKR